MSLVNIANVKIDKNETSIKDPINLEIEISVNENLTQNVRFKVTYIVSGDEALDQVLTMADVGPFALGKSKFTLSCPAPDLDKIPKDELVGSNVLVLSAEYKNQEFVRVGYYVNNKYNDEELDKNPPESPIIDKLVREILSGKPIVTKKNIEYLISFFLFLFPFRMFD